ncbi:TPA_asm: P3 [Lonas gammacytorhabdovirus 1]|nr:TPA_asm: P3 [Lonas gammacytorhabdovirus 1]
MVFLANLPLLIKSKLVVKQNKTQGFGKNGEIHGNRWKTRVYMVTKPTKMKYVEVRSISLSWSPTVAHMLSGNQISIKVHDSRGTSGANTSERLLTINKSADTSWELSTPCSITFPMREISDGFPLSVDVDISAANIKADTEIGVLTISLSISSCKAVEKFFMGPAKFKYSDDRVDSIDSITWKGMKENHRDAKEITDDSITRVSAIVTRYLNGAITSNEMVSLLDNKMWIC